MRAKKEQKKLNRRPHPSYPSAVNDLLGLLRASQSFHTTLCPVTYLREKQSCNSLSGSRGEKIHKGRQISAAQRELCSSPPKLHMNNRTEEDCSLQSSLPINSVPKHITGVPFSLVVPSVPILESLSCLWMQKVVSRKEKKPLKAFQIIFFKLLPPSN